MSDRENPGTERTADGTAQELASVGERLLRAYEAPRLDSYPLSSVVRGGTGTNFDIGTQGDTGGPPQPPGPGD